MVWEKLIESKVVSEKIYWKYKSGFRKSLSGAKWVKKKFLGSKVVREKLIENKVVWEKNYCKYTSGLRKAYSEKM